jgi:beta-galactosidase GanA
MVDRYPSISAKFPHFLHGGDYNPDQWPEDMRQHQALDYQTVFFRGGKTNWQQLGHQ